MQCKDTNPTPTDVQIPRGGFDSQWICLCKVSLGVRLFIVLILSVIKCKGIFSKCVVSFIKKHFGNTELPWNPRNDCNLLLTSNLVSHSLGLNDGDVINDSLVEVEILGKSR